MWKLSGFADEISHDPTVQINVLNELSINWIELRSAWKTNILDLTSQQVEHLAKLLAASEISVSSIASPIGKIALSGDLEKHFQKFEHALKLAAVFPAKYVRIFSFYMPEGEDPHRHRDAVIEQLARMARRAERAGVILLHENEKRIYGDAPQRCLDLVAAVASPNLKLAWDPANFVQCGIVPFPEGYEQLRPYLEYVHVKDARLDDGVVVPAGEGDGQIPATMKALHGDKFDGFCSIEPHLKQGGPRGGLDGPKKFRIATGAFKRILANLSIDIE